MISKMSHRDCHSFSTRYRIFPKTQVPSNENICLPEKGKKETRVVAKTCYVFSAVSMIVRSATASRNVAEANDVCVSCPYHKIIIVSPY